MVTYDEFGGQWDHVSPPGQGGARGPHDQWGPGTRIPALIVSPDLRSNFVVDHTQYDTTSILATIEAPLPPRAAELARRGRERPLRRLPREGAARRGRGQLGKRRWIAPAALG